jgi:hypothetical protein
MGDESDSRGEADLDIKMDGNGADDEDDDNEDDNDDDNSSDDGADDDENEDKLADDASNGCCEHGTWKTLWPPAHCRGTSTRHAPHCALRNAADFSAADCLAADFSAADFSAAAAEWWRLRSASERRAAQIGCSAEADADTGNDEDDDDDDDNEDEDKDIDDDDDADLIKEDDMVEVACVLLASASIAFAL